MSEADLGLPAGVPVVLYLHNPREKVWGMLLSLSMAGIVVRGLELSCFDDWLQQEKRGEDEGLSPLTIFYPMHRLERLERDESTSAVISYADRFVREVGRPLEEVASFRAR